MKIYVLVLLLATIALFAHWPQLNGTADSREPQG
jgi:hypothetical protein